MSAAAAGGDSDVLEANMRTAHSHWRRRVRDQAVTSSCVRLGRVLLLLVPLCLLLFGAPPEAVPG
jgi:hypothetical protein